MRFWGFAPYPSDKTERRRLLSLFLFTRNIVNFASG